MTEPVVRLADNPILVAQAQRRLRRGQLIPSLLIVGILCACGVLWSLARGGEAEHFRELAYAALFACGAALLLRAPMQIAGALCEERTSGILDFHRATPLTPWTQAVGYVLGCGSREYLIAGVFTVLYVPAALVGQVSPLAVVLSLGFVALAGLLYGTFAMWIGLSLANKRGVSGVVVGTLLMLLSFGWAARELGSLAYLTPFPTLARVLGFGSRTEIGADVIFYGVNLHPGLFSLIVQSSVLLFLGWAAARKLRQEGSPSFSRPGALGLLGWLLFVSIGGAWRWIAGESGPTYKHFAEGSLVAYVLIATTLASALLISVSPAYLGFVRGLRRARRRGQDAAHFLTDEGSPWPIAALLAGQVLIGFTVLWLALRDRLSPGEGLTQAAGLLGVAIPAFMLFVCGASEYTRLVRRGAVRSTGVLIFFVTMVLPGLLGGIFAAGLGKQATLYILALSPGYGVFGAAVLFASASSGDTNTGDVTLITVVLSLAVTLGLAVWCFISSRSVRESLGGSVALGTPKRTP